MTQIGDPFVYDIIPSNGFIFYAVPLVNDHASGYFHLKYQCLLNFIHATNSMQPTLSRSNYFT